VTNGAFLFLIQIVGPPLADGPALLLLLFFSLPENNIDSARYGSLLSSLSRRFSVMIDDRCFSFFSFSRMKQERASVPFFSLLIGRVFSHVTSFFSLFSFFLRTEVHRKDCDISPERVQGLPPFFFCGASPSLKRSRASTFFFSFWERQRMEKGGPTCPFFFFSFSFQTRSDPFSEIFGARSRLFFFLFLSEKSSPERPFFSFSSCSPLDAGWVGRGRILFFLPGVGEASCFFLFFFFPLAKSPILGILDGSRSPLFFSSPSSRNDERGGTTYRAFLFLFFFRARPCSARRRRPPSFFDGAPRADRARHARPSFSLPLARVIVSPFRAGRARAFPFFFSFFSSDPEPKRCREREERDLSLSLFSLSGHRARRPTPCAPLFPPFCGERTSRRQPGQRASEPSPFFFFFFFSRLGPCAAPTLGQPFFFFFFSRRVDESAIDRPARLLFFFPSLRSLLDLAWVSDHDRRPLFFFPFFFSLTTTSKRS